VATIAAETERYLELYRRMVLIRGFEDLIQSLFLRGEIYGTTHLYSGQEAVAVGVASALEDRDRVAATYRGHGHALALGVDPQALLDEMLGRATGINGGRAGSMNINSPNDRCETSGGPAIPRSASGIAALMRAFPSRPAPAVPRLGPAVRVTRPGVRRLSVALPEQWTPHQPRPPSRDRDRPSDRHGSAKGFHLHDRRYRRIRRQGSSSADRQQRRALLLAPRQDVGEALLLEHAEQRLAGQAGLRERRARESAQEARLLPRVPQEPHGGHYVLEGDGRARSTAADRLRAYGLSENFEIH